MLKRKIDKILKEWKNDRRQECLLVNGARQVGKTFSIRQFARECYESFVEINFIENPVFISAFDYALDSESFLQQLRLRLPDFRLVEGNTMIFLDEIQECPKARTALKFLAQDQRFDVVASGSLITLMSQDVPSLPVGYEREVVMYPLSFEEFLWAKGFSAQTSSDLRAAITRPSILSTGVVSLYTSLLNEFMMTGGMPAAVSAYVNEAATYDEVKTIQNNILRLNFLDIEKYSAGLDRERIRLALEGIINQSGDGKKSFSYAKIEKGRSRARDYRPAVEWLKNAHLVYSSASVSRAGIPLSMYTEPGTERLYFYDIGLFFALVSGDSTLLRNRILSNEWEGFAKGRFYEALAADLLHKNGHSLYYLDIPQKMEIDFIIESESAIVPIEVKSRNNKALSLSRLLASSDIPLGIKLTESSCGLADRILTLPLFMAAFL